MEGHCNHVEEKTKLIKMVLEESKHDAREYSLQGGQEEKINHIFLASRQLHCPVKITYCSPFYLVDINNKHPKAIHE